jgi:3',5'-cyclic AMP phosphodiesterase CpdA
MKENKMSELHPAISRRSLLAGGMGALGASIVSPTIVAEAATPAKPGGVRFAHLTDMHVEPERRGGEGFKACLESLRKLDPQPTFLLTGGDHVFDAFAQTPDRCATQWDLYQQVWRDAVSLPTHAVLGNHDVAGWGDANKFSEATDGWGKAMAVAKLSMPSRYYSFEMGGWKFLMLDSISRREPGYVATFDDEQKQWIKDELAKTDAKTPVAVVSHIPILCVSIFFFEPKVQDKSIVLSDALLHRDAMDMWKIFEKHDNVKLIISGHLHLVDRCDYKGRTFICDGAVSGAWWKGPHQGFAEGYGVFDVYPDGTFEHQYVAYGWKA